MYAKGLLMRALHVQFPPLVQSLSTTRYYFCFLVRISLCLHSEERGLVSLSSSCERTCMPGKINRVDEMAFVPIAFPKVLSLCSEAIQRAGQFAFEFSLLSLRAYGRRTYQIKLCI